MFWIVLGALVTISYDRRLLYRMPPRLMDYLDRAVRDYKRQSGQPTATSGTQ